MHPWVWGRMRLYGVQGTQSVRAEDEPETRPIIGEEGSTLRLTTTERRLKPRTSPESQPRLGFTGASKKFCPSSFFFTRPSSESQNLEDGSDRQTKKESSRVHVSTCLQRDSETREYTKADTQPPVG